VLVPKDRIGLSVTPLMYLASRFLCPGTTKIIHKTEKYTQLMLIYSKPIEKILF